MTTRRTCLALSAAFTLTAAQRRVAEEIARDIAVAVRELEPRCVMVLLEPGEFEADALG